MSKLGLENEDELKTKNDNICWIIEKAREFYRKTSTSLSSTTPKTLTVWIIILWKPLKEMGIPDHLT